MAGFAEQPDRHGVQPTRARSRSRLLAVALLLVLVGAVAPTSAAAPSPETVTCGEAITHSIVIGNDLTGCGFEKTVLTVGADHITIDLNGHSLYGNWSSALSSTGHSYVTIENGSLGTNVNAIQLNGDHNDTVRNVTATGGGEGGGVGLYGGSENSVVDSTVEGSPTSAPLVLNNENDDVIAGNTALGYFGLEIGGGAGNQVTHNTTARIDVTDSGDLIEANVIAPYALPVEPGLIIEGNSNSVIANSVSGSAFSFSQFVQFQDGIKVTGSGNVLSGNTAAGSVGDGIHVLTSDNTLTANVADNNGAYGIEAVSGVIDGGQNSASGNSNTPQCVNVDCSAQPVSHVPGIPGGLTATAGNGSVALSWDSNASTDAVTHYTVYRTDQWFSGPWATPVGTSFTNASAVLNGTRYCYQVTATNATGESAKTAPVCATPTGPPTPVPSTPSGLTVTPGNGSVALSWQPNPTGDAVTYYSVYRTDQTFSSAWATLTGTAYGDAFDVVNGTLYCYQLSASNGNGESAKTAPVCATPTAPTPAPQTPHIVTPTPPAVPPAPRTTGHPAGTSTQTTATFTFTDSQAGVQFKCRLDGGAFSNCSSPRRYSGLGIGQHTFHVEALNSLAQAGAAASYTWTVKGTVNGILKGAVGGKYIITSGNVHEWAWAAVVDQFYGARGATKLTAFRVTHCAKQRSGRFRCDVSWRKSQYAFSGTVTTGSVNPRTGQFKFGFSLLRRNTHTGAKKRVNLPYS